MDVCVSPLPVYNPQSVLLNWSVNDERPLFLTHLLFKPAVPPNPDQLLHLQPTANTALL